MQHHENIELMLITLKNSKPFAKLMPNYKKYTSLGYRTQQSLVRFREHIRMKRFVANISVLLLLAGSVQSQAANGRKVAAGVTTFAAGLFTVAWFTDMYANLFPGAYGPGEGIEKSQDEQLFWINWTPHNSSGVAKKLSYVAGRQFVHTSLLIIPPEATIVQSPEGLLKIMLDGKETLPLDYLSFYGRGAYDDYISDRAEYSMNLKDKTLIAEFFPVTRDQLPADLNKNLRSPVNQAIFQKLSGLKELYRQAEIELLQHSDLYKLRKLAENGMPFTGKELIFLNTNTPADTSLTEFSDNIKTIQAFLQHLSNQERKAFVNYWQVRRQISFIKHAFRTLEIPFSRQKSWTSEEALQQLTEKAPSEDNFTEQEKEAVDALTVDAISIYQTFVKTYGAYKANYSVLGSNCTQKALQSFAPTAEEEPTKESGTLKEKTSRYLNSHSKYLPQASSRDFYKILYPEKTKNIFQIRKLNSQKKDFAPGAYSSFSPEGGVYKIHQGIGLIGTAALSALAFWLVPASA